ncbi:3 phosphatase [uncultured virus]|nr:3 phosphatase [uncultured virus]
MQLLDDGLYFYPSVIQTPYIAGFDLGMTLTRPVSGETSQSADDWTFLPNRLPTLKRLQDDGYTIVIFTNQTLKYHSCDLDTKQSKIEMNLDRKDQIIAALKRSGIHPWVFASTEQNEYRKPHVGMWKALLKVWNVPIDLTRSFFVGDSAGRKPDKTSNDKLFAKYIGINFYIPEEVF